MNIKAENLSLSTDHTTQMKHDYLKIFTLPTTTQKINQLCSLHSIEKLYLNLLCSRKTQSTSIWFDEFQSAQQYWTDSSLYSTLTFCWLNRLFCCGNKRFVVFEVLATFETLANTRWKQQNQLADVWKEHSVSSSPEHRDLSIPSHPWLKAAPRLQCWGDDLLSPWLTSIIELHFLSYCILKRDNEQQSFFAHEISVNVLLLFKNSRTTVLLTQNITLVVLSGYI